MRSSARSEVGLFFFLGGGILGEGQEKSGIFANIACISWANRWGYGGKGE